MRRVAVIMGGKSKEREVSLVSGKAVADALDECGYDVVTVDVGRDIGERLSEIAPDVVFNALHGRWGEDGCVQGVLETLEIPYTHSGVLASALAMNKVIAKAVFRSVELRVPEGKVISASGLFHGDPLPRPYVVKPVSEGSSVGVAIITDDGTHGHPINPEAPGPWREYEELLVEPYIPGRELAVSVMGDKALAVTELKPKRGFYDFDAKYTEGLTEHVLPPALPREVTDQAKLMALAAHDALGCRGVSRADLRYDGGHLEGGRLYLLEINTQPGMTPLSLVPEQAAHTGIDFPALVEWIVEDASCSR